MITLYELTSRHMNTYYLLSLLYKKIVSVRFLSRWIDCFDIVNSHQTKLNTYTGRTFCEGWTYFHNSNK